MTGGDEHAAHALNCPENYNDIGSGCVLAPAERLPAPEAQSLCHDLHGALATLDRCDIFADAVHYLEESGGVNDSFWISGTYSVARDEWQWRDGRAVAMGVPFWGTSGGGALEPSQGNCSSFFHKSNPYLGASPCDEHYSPLCEEPPTLEGRCNVPSTAVGSQCLRFAVNDTTSWETARMMCSANDGDLASFGSCEQFSVVVDYILKHDLQSINGYWVGGFLSDEKPEWSWVDGSSLPLGVPFWGQNNAGQLLPNNSTVERCLELGSEYRHRFNDLDCQELRRPLCMAASLI
ncbi:uncharacterized protein LOC108675303 [Hyalella azteca]|uniref:Uncharacterized protein LOC108675303 n=1 Tax=Hyalella azteca TaxID=294128 RepID=A0A979FFK0_HYAAZ|nr:uncharacterized protein LOC108675303 [Hyalella azteca]